MKTIGLFYAMNAAKTSHIAEKIREDLGGPQIRNRPHKMTQRSKR